MLIEKANRAISDNYEVIVRTTDSMKNAEAVNQATLIFIKFKA